jgi:hypothetical protein
MLVTVSDGKRYVQTKTAGGYNPDVFDDVLTRSVDAIVHMRSTRHMVAARTHYEAMRAEYLEVEGFEPTI